MFSVQNVAKAMAHNNTGNLWQAMRCECNAGSFRGSQRPRKDVPGRWDHGRPHARPWASCGRHLYHAPEQWIVRDWSKKANLPACINPAN